MRTLSGHIESLVSQMSDLGRDMREVRDKVLQFEAAKLETQINEVRADYAALLLRISSLEMAKASDTGARTLAQEVRDWMPVLCMIGAGLLFWFKHS